MDRVFTRVVEVHEVVHADLTTVASITVVDLSGKSIHAHVRTIVGGSKVGVTGWLNLHQHAVLTCRSRPPITAAPFAGKAGKTKNLGVAKQNQQQQQQRRPSRPLCQRCLPLIVSSAVLHGLSFCFFSTKRPREDRVFFALLCFMGGIVAVEAADSAIKTFGGVHPAVGAAVSHFKANASG